MNVTFWGTRGSLAAAGPETVRYGGDTSCVEVVAADGGRLVLDAGSGIRRLSALLPDGADRVDILLTHLHMDHIQGLGFFAPLFDARVEVHVWGPPSATLDLRARLSRYLSPPLFPVRVRDLGSRVLFHDAPDKPTAIGSFTVTAAPIVHPGLTVGFRIAADDVSLAYLPDHEPVLGRDELDGDLEWTSGSALAAGVEMLIHDTQYTPEERAARLGWGHSSHVEAARFAKLVGARHLVSFHHDPSHDDATLDRLIAETAVLAAPVEVVGARQGETLSVTR